jgi:hypothetical protein
MAEGTEFPAKKNRTPIKEFGFLWYHSDLNQGLTDFQSVALPTELWYRFNRATNVKQKMFNSNMSVKKLTA